MSDQPEDYIRQLSIDCVIFGYEDGSLYVLLPKLALSKAYYMLPGGFIHQSEGIDEAAYRILSHRTGLEGLYLDQFRVFGAAGRSNDTLIREVLDSDTEIPEASAFIRTNRKWLLRRFISIGYYALVDMRRVAPTKAAIDESVEWYPITELPNLILDHRQMVDQALLTLRRYLDEKLIGFNLLPEKFTMKELRLLYEAIYGQPFRRNNFQKKMLGLNVLERLEKKFTGAANRAPYLYRLRRKVKIQE